MTGSAVLVLGLMLLPAQEKQSHQVVRVTDPDARRPVEVSVAINPKNPEHILAVSMQSPRPGANAGNYAYVSNDGGITWKSSPLSPMERRIQGDDVVAFGSDGVAYRTFIAFNG